MPCYSQSDASVNANQKGLHACGVDRHRDALACSAGRFDAKPQPQSFIVTYGIPSGADDDQSGQMVADPFLLPSWSVTARITIC